jgi:hypothetical protein
MNDEVFGHDINEDLDKMGFIKTCQNMNEIKSGKMSKLDIQFQIICEKLDNFKYPLTGEQQTKLKKWLLKNSKRKDKEATIGGRFTYEITPTGVGECIVICDNASRDKIDLTDYENW